MKAGENSLSAVIAGLCWVASAGHAQAYLDPGAGSFILQILIGSIAGGLVVLKLYWEKARSYVGGFLQQRSADGVSDKKEE
jgi:hypothetical protein